MATSIYPNAAGAGWIGFKSAGVRIPSFWPAIELDMRFVAPQALTPSSQALRSERGWNNEK